MKSSFIFLNLFLLISTARAEQNENEVRITVREQEIKSMYILVDDIGEPITYAEACKKYPEYCPQLSKKPEPKAEIKTEKKLEEVILAGPTLGASTSTEEGRAGKIALTGGFQFFYMNPEKKSYAQVHMRMDERSGEGKFSTIQAGEAGRRAFELNLTSGSIGAMAGKGWSANNGQILNAILVGAAISSASGKNGSGIDNVTCMEVPVKFKHVAAVKSGAIIEIDLGGEILACKDTMRNGDENLKGLKVAPIISFQGVLPIGEKLFFKANAGLDPKVFDNTYNEKVNHSSLLRGSLQLGFNLGEAETKHSTSR